MVATNGWIFSINRSGLSWGRWLAAAMRGVPRERHPRPRDSFWRILRQDWQKDVDPAEWARDLSDGARAKRG